MQNEHKLHRTYLYSRTCTLQEEYLSISTKHFSSQIRHLNTDSICILQRWWPDIRVVYIFVKLIPLTEINSISN